MILMPMVSYRSYINFDSAVLDS